MDVRAASPSAAEEHTTQGDAVDAFLEMHGQTEVGASPFVGSTVAVVGVEVTPSCAQSCLEISSDNEGCDDGEADSNGGSRCSSDGVLAPGSREYPVAAELRDSLCIHGGPFLAVVEACDEGTHGFRIVDAKQDVQEADEEAEGRCMMHTDVSAEHGVVDDEGVGEGPAAADEEDVLKLEGMVDHDQVAMLPAAPQDEDVCADVAPPDSLAFGDGASGSLSDDDDADEGHDQAEHEHRDLDESMDDDDSSHESRGSSTGEITVHDGLGQGWLRYFEHLKAFKDKHGHAHVRPDEALGSWVCVQRRNFKTGKLTREQELMLGSLGLYFGDDNAGLLNKRAYYGAGSPNGELSSESTPRSHDHARLHLPARSRLPWRERREQELAQEYVQELMPTTDVQSIRARGRPAGSGRGRVFSHDGAGDSSAEVPAAAAMGCDVTQAGRTGRAAPRKPFGAGGADGRTSGGGSGRDRVSRLPGVWRETDCIKATDLASRFMEGLVFQALGSPLNKKRGREAWLQDFNNALRSERKGIWCTNERRVSQLLRSLETHLPWRTMGDVFRYQRAPLLDSIKEIKTAADVMLLLHKLTAFTKLEFWRDGYRSYRLDVEAQVRPRGGWMVEVGDEQGEQGHGQVQHSEQDTAVPGTKRQLQMGVGRVCPGQEGAEAASSRAASPPGIPPVKRRKLAPAHGATAQQGVGEWLRRRARLDDATTERVLSCLADETWGVSSVRMLAALTDAQLEEMLAPAGDHSIVKRVVHGVRALRPLFFAHVSRMLSSNSPTRVKAEAEADEPGENQEKSTPPACTAAEPAARSNGARTSGRSARNGKASANGEGRGSLAAKRAQTRGVTVRPLMAATRSREDRERRVAELRGKKMAADGVVWYLAHWEGCDSEEDTWEQAAGLGSDEWLVSEWEAEQSALRKPEISVRAV